MLTQMRHAPPPSAAETYTALRQIAVVFGMHTCWLYQRRYHFTVGSGWTIALSGDSAGRFRLDTCHHTRTVSSLWVLREDRDRLAALALSLRDRLGVQAPRGADEPFDIRGFN